METGAALPRWHRHVCGRPAWCPQCREYSNRFHQASSGGESSIGATRTSAWTEKELYPAWQGMQYLRNMFDGRAKPEPLDNDRYPGICWTTARDVLCARQVNQLRAGKIRCAPAKMLRRVYAGGRVDIMEGTEIEVAILQPGEKVIGSAYLTPDGEIVFSPHAGAIEVVLVEPPANHYGPWAIRRRPATHLYGHP